jgi:hypothetical protein
MAGIGAFGGIPVQHSTRAKPHPGTHFESADGVRSGDSIFGDVVAQVDPVRARLAENMISPGEVVRNRASLGAGSLQDVEHALQESRSLPDVEEVIELGRVSHDVVTADLAGIAERKEKVEDEATRMTLSKIENAKNPREVGKILKGLTGQDFEAEPVQSGQ